MRPYYQHAGITIYNGPCEAVISGLPVVDLVFTSPPYNLGGGPWAKLGKGEKRAKHNAKWEQGPTTKNGIGYQGHSDSMPHESYVAWQKEVLRLCWENLSETGAIYYNHKPRVIGGALWLPLELTEGLPLRQIITWARAGGMNFNHIAYVPTYEWIILLAKAGFRLRDQSASGVGDCWRVPQEPDKAHPAPFPLALPLRAIETTCAKIILDPFCGTGSTLQAAKLAGREAIGIEIEESYCEIAANRLSQEVLAL